MKKSKKLMIGGAIIIFLLILSGTIYLLRLEAKINFIWEGLGKLQMREEVCFKNNYVCGDFETRENAQALFDFCNTNTRLLDRDEDGIACENINLKK
ncbi:MAG TPA: hypothetical protein ENI23_12640 [bacterium]|nr:hypothetical protein [bacterium]